MRDIFMTMAVGLVFILAGCGTSKKVAQSTHVDDAIALQVQSKCDSSALQTIAVDTTKVAVDETMYTEIVFTRDTSQAKPDITIDADGGIHIQGGNVAAIRQFGNKRKAENVGKTDIETNVVVKDTTAVALDATTKRDTQVKEEPAADPYRWRYIWRILATLVGVAIAVLLWIFRNKICNWVIKMPWFARILK